MDLVEDLTLFLERLPHSECGMRSQILEPKTSEVLSILFVAEDDIS